MAAATTGFVGKGTLFGYSVATGAGPYTYTNMALVVSISPNITVGEAENVVLASTFKGYLPTLPEAECDFTVKYAFGDAGVAEIITLAGSGTVIHWQIKTTDLSTIIFDGFLKSFNPTFETE